MKKSRWAEESLKRIKNNPEFLAMRKMIRINEKLVARMEEMGISQRELARITKKSQPFISRLLNRGTNTTIKTLLEISQALNLTLEIDVKEKSPVEIEVETDSKNFLSYRIIFSSETLSQEKKNEQPVPIFDATNLSKAG